jgi:drug/metabolite transporter (DMT)-like permease
LNDNIKAAMLVVIGMSMISSNDAIMKLGSAKLGIGQILFIRGMLATLIFAIVIKSTGRQLFPKIALTKWNLARAGCECLATICFITGLSLLPIAIASTLVWTSPIFLTICAAVYLKEQVTVARGIAVFTGFIGVLFVTNPFYSEFTWAMILPLVAAAFVVTRDMLTRQLDSQLHSLYVVFTTLILVTLTGGFISLLDWRPVEISQVGWLAVSAALLSMGFFCQISAVRIGELSFIAPFSFTGILVSVMYGYLVWGEIPTIYMATGIALIIGSGLYILMRRGKITQGQTTVSGKDF